MPVQGFDFKLLASAFGLITCSSLPFAPAAKAGETTAPQTDISIGTPAGECAIPGVVELKRGNKCTGTLIHPRVVLFAAHCNKPRDIIFGERGQGPKLSQFQKIAIHPNFKQGASAGENGSRIDWAVAVLSKPVTGLPIIPLAAAGELDAFQKANQDITLAGFGRTTQNQHYGRLLWTGAKIEEITNGSMTTVPGKHNACSGDSGGPVLVRLGDGSWRTIGITTNLGPTLMDCGKDTGYNRLSQVRPEMFEWLEKETGIDLTLCYNDAGEIDRGPECKNFFAGDLKAPSGSWSNNCADAKVVAKPKLTPKGGGGEGGEPEDTTAPQLKLELVDVKDTDKLAVGDKVEIEVEIEDESDIAAASLHINGKEVKSWKKAPYTFSWKIEKAGDVEIQAKAKDEPGNEGESEVLKLKVQGDEPGEGKPNNSEDPGGNNTPGEGNTPKEEPSEKDPTPKTPQPEPSEPKEPEPKDPTEKPSTKTPAQNGEGEGGCQMGKQDLGGWALGLIGLLGVFGRRRRSA